MHDFTIVCTNALLTFSVLLKNAIEILIDVSKHMGDVRINLGLPNLEYIFGELREDKLFVIRVMEQVYSMYQ